MIAYEATMKTLLLMLTLAALAPIGAYAADRDTVAEQVAEKCRKDWPSDYHMQVLCREQQMEAFDKLEKEDAARSRGRQQDRPK